MSTAVSSPAPAGTQSSVAPISVSAVAKASSQSTPAPDSVPDSVPTTIPSTSALSQPPQHKQIHALVVDTGPLIKNDPAVSTLLAKADHIYTIPAVLGEIRDAATRARIEATLLPFLRVRSPRPSSVKFVHDFARKTGDLEVMSRADVGLIALAYELQCERDGGDWRLKKEPGAKAETEEGSENANNTSGVCKGTGAGVGVEAEAEKAETEVNDSRPESEIDKVDSQMQHLSLESVNTSITLSDCGHASQIQRNGAAEGPNDTNSVVDADKDNGDNDDDDDDDDDDEGWITPDNVQKHIEADKRNQAKPEEVISEPLGAALLTSDYAMQNVTLRIGLALLSPALHRIRELRSWVLRCHGCFAITRDTSKQFCPRCGQATLLRVSCSTDENGKFQIHLKKNFQWNKRGNIYSVPKPTHGTANGKYRGQGGGKQGWGTSLILTGDQKEYTRILDQKRRDMKRHKDLMDDDSLPGILSGDRRGTGNAAWEKVKLGPGRAVNARRTRH